jgi:16S rRNA (uracil1498-N3)-methyltransferase
MSERFYSPAAGHDDTVVLTGEEAHHLARVRRFRPGERVQLFDGAGIECEAEVRSARRDEVVLGVVSRQRVSRELPFALTLACAPPKGDRLRWLVEKATELGVTRFIPILTERANEQTQVLKRHKLTRWVVEASKQCGRNVLMEVTDTVEFAAHLNLVPADHHRLIASPTGKSLRTVELGGGPGGVAITIGPEGGFTPGELDAARACGWSDVSLGPRILRVETAAIVAASWVMAPCADPIAERSLHAPREVGGISSPPSSRGA